MRTKNEFSYMKEYTVSPKGPLENNITDGQLRASDVSVDVKDEDIGTIVVLRIPTTKEGT